MEDTGSTPLIRGGNLDGSISTSDARPADEAEFKAVPPSPALSSIHSSIHFTASPVLRETKPDDGATSLSLLNPKDNPRSHPQRPLNATTATDIDGTAADLNHSPRLSPPHPTASDVTPIGLTVGTHVGSASGICGSQEQKQKHKKTREEIKGNAEKPEAGADGDDEDRQTELDLTQDEHIDPTPFAFEPYRLASLVNPKNLEALEAMGGIDGLLAGLGVDPTNGLNNVPPVEDRQRVYGPNTLPVCKSKSLLGSMWLALKDKVLVNPQSFTFLIDPIELMLLLP